LDSGLQHPLPPWCRRHLGAADPADQFHDHGRRCRRLGSHREAGGAVHGVLPHHVRSHDRCFQRAGYHSLLRVLGSDADPDVPCHRDLGRTEPRLRHHQVLPLHAARLTADAGGFHLSLSPDRQFLTDRLLSVAAGVAGADPDLLRLLHGFRRQDPDVAGAHLAAGCARRGADRRFRRAGGHHAEAGRLQFPALRHADRA